MEMSKKVSGLLAIGLIMSITSAYAGCIQGNCKDGWGVKKWDTGFKYSGDHKNGKRNGSGVMNYPSGKIYDGEWKNGVRHGQGANYTSNATYNGGWYADKKHGDGYNYLCHQKNYKCGSETDYATYKQKWVHGKNKKSVEVVPTAPASGGSSSSKRGVSCEPDFRYKDGSVDVGYCGNTGAHLQCGYGDTIWSDKYWCRSGGTEHGYTLQSAVNKACGCD